MTTQPTNAEQVKEVPTMLTLRADLSRFTGAGYGTLRHVPAGLEVGQTIAVTDDEADTIEAVVISVDGDTAEVRVHWNRVLRRA